MVCNQNSDECGSETTYTARQLKSPLSLVSLQRQVLLKIVPLTALSSPLDSVAPHSTRAAYFSHLIINNKCSPAVLLNLSAAFDTIEFYTPKPIGKPIWHLQPGSHVVIVLFI